MEEPDKPWVLLFCRLLGPCMEALSLPYRVLKPWESPLPLHQFLQSVAESVSAAITRGPRSVDAALIRSLPALKFLFTTSAGLDHIDLDECKRREIAVAYAGTLFSEDAADYAVGLFLDALRRISAADRYVRRGLWAVRGDYPLLGSKLGGKHVGIIGLGSIGLEVAKRLEAFGCIISYNSRKQKPLLPYQFFANVCDLAAKCDALIVCCAYNTETYHLINEDVLLSLGAKGVIINVGRGKLVDEKALVNCLAQGKIGGAGLDVFENEPDVPQELYNLDNVVLSPHRAVLTEESRSGMRELMLSNLDAFFANKPLVSPVPI